MTARVIFEVPRIRRVFAFFRDSVLRIPRVTIIAVFRVRYSRYLSTLENTLKGSALRYSKYCELSVS